MKVKDLIENLNKRNQESEIYLESGDALLDINEITNGKKENGTEFTVIIPEKQVVQCNATNGEGCGMHGVTDDRCCYNCEFKNKCEGICVTLESLGDTEETMRNCADFNDI